MSEVDRYDPETGEFKGLPDEWQDLLDKTGALKRYGDKVKRETSV